MKKSLIILASLLLTAPALAKVDLVTLPERDQVEVTIYNSADLTLVRETRTLSLRKGKNRLQYSWAGTLIDPTSLELAPLGNSGSITVDSIEYPPRVTGVGIWNLDSKTEGKLPFEITSFTSGLSWRAYYLATLSQGEEEMSLEGYVRVDNRTGEDFTDVSTRLVVGKINLIDQIADLARRGQPYGSPFNPVYEAPAAAGFSDRAERTAMAKSIRPMMAEMRPKEIVKEGLSEYFLYTIEGTEDISNGWGKRLISFAAPKVPVKNLYRFDEDRYGPKPVRFLNFKNDKAHNLGKEPIPDGLVKVYRAADKEGHLAYVGAEQTKYVPQDGEVNMNLGPSDLVSVKPLLMDYATDNYEWRKETITGFDAYQTFKVEVKNSQPIPAKVEIRRNLGGSKWEIENEGDFGKFEKVDADTVQYTLDLPPNGEKTFSYRVHSRTGSRGM